jgi:hypothetical protein
MRSYECRWSTTAACPCVEQKLRVTPPREVVASQAMFLLYVTAAAEGSFICPHMIWGRGGQHLYYAGNWQKRVVPCASMFALILGTGVELLYGSNKL